MHCITTFLNDLCIYCQLLVKSKHTYANVDTLQHWRIMQTFMLIVCIISYIVIHLHIVYHTPTQRYLHVPGTWNGIPSVSNIHSNIYTGTWHSTHSVSHIHSNISTGIWHMTQYTQCITHSLKDYIHVPDLVHTLYHTFTQNIYRYLVHDTITVYHTST